VDKNIFMRLTNDDLVNELKIRIGEEKSLRKKVLLKNMLELAEAL
jgi:hypothetical protein